MPESLRVLFVDDDPALRRMWATILPPEGFDYTDASTVAEALVLITREKYDVLISDLNIGSPGDGFTVVSAMRRVQPEAVTLILTGYPAFQAALRAIHEQVDDFLTKPAEPEKVITCIKDNLTRRRKRPGNITVQRLPELISQNRRGIIDSWYEAVQADREISKIYLSREDRVDHLPDVLDELVRPRESSFPIDPEARNSAAKHGRKRREQGYTPSMLLEETRMLHNAIAECTQDNLLTVDISTLLTDLIKMDDSLHRILRYSLEAFLEPDRASDAA